MAEWLYEAGIGETRAALVEAGRILEMAVERDDDGPQVGAVLDARLSRAADQTGRGEALLADGRTVRLKPAPRLGLGHPLRVEILREAMPGPLDPKPPLARPTDLPLGDGPRLRARLSGAPVRAVAPHGPDLLEAHGWSEAMEEADTGLIARDVALLRLHLTPAMTLIDVDGSQAPAALAIAGARLAGETIRRFDLGGAIGIDLPTLAARAERQAAAQALDAALPAPFERTGVNGFGFLQLVRRRPRPSLVELIAADRPRAAALALLRRAERDTGAGARRLAAHPAVIAVLDRQLDWRQALERRLGARVALRSDPARSIWSGYVEPDD